MPQNIAIVNPYTPGNRQRGRYTEDRIWNAVAAGAVGNFLNPMTYLNIWEAGKNENQRGINNKRAEDEFKELQAHNKAMRELTKEQTDAMIEASRAQTKLAQEQFDASEKQKRIANVRERGTQLETIMRTQATDAYTPAAEEQLSAARRISPMLRGADVSLGKAIEGVADREVSSDDVRAFNSAVDAVYSSFPKYLSAAAEGGLTAGEADASAQTVAAVMGLRSLYDSLPDTEKSRLGDSGEKLNMLASIIEPHADVFGGSMTKAHSEYDRSVNDVALRRLSEGSRTIGMIESSIFDPASVPTPIDIPSLWNSVGQGGPQYGQPSFDVDAPWVGEMIAAMTKEKTGSATTPKAADAFVAKIQNEKEKKDRDWSKLVGDHDQIVSDRRAKIMGAINAGMPSAALAEAARGIGQDISHDWDRIVGYDYGGLIDRVLGGMKTTSSDVPTIPPEEAVRIADEMAARGYSSGPTPAVVPYSFWEHLKRGRNPSDDEVFLGGYTRY